MVDKREFQLEGLGCASCAAQLETKIALLPGVERVQINFVTGTLIIEAERSLFWEIVEKTKVIIRQIEPHVLLSVKDKKLTNKGFLCSVERKRKLFKYLIGVIFFMGAVFLPLSFLEKFFIYLLSYLIIGGEVLLRALRNIGRGRFFDENSLMVLATIGAFFLKEFPEAVAVMVFYQAGEFLQEKAVRSSRQSIENLLNIKPAYAMVKRTGETVQVKPQDVKKGEHILIKPGEKIPLDGIIIEGSSEVDTSLITGESLWRSVGVGDELLSGYINTTGVLTVEVTKEYEHSTVAKILELVENAGNKKAPTEQFITKFARYYTPLVVILALLIAIFPPLLFNTSFSLWFYRALIFLVISCPCALMVSIPLGFFGGIGAASKQGVLFKGGNYLEALNHVHTLVFDKTGTLTRGVFEVIKIQPAEGFSELELLEYAVLAGAYSNHTISQSIRAYYKQPIDTDKILVYEELAGLGVRVQINKGTLLMGNRKLMTTLGLITQDKIPGTVIHVALNEIYLGFLVLGDTLKKDAYETVQALRNLGIKNLVMLTGDTHEAAKKVSNKVGIKQVFSELLPQDKVAVLESLMKGMHKGKKVVFVGDGMNDAPVLARADIGVAMGGIGSDAAIEAADIVITTDEPSKIIKAFQIAKKTKVIVWQNIVLALGTKGVVLCLGILGLASMWGAVFADVGVALLAVMNSMRIMHSD